MTDTASHRDPYAASRAQVWTREFPAHPDQVGQARKFLALALEGCPVADDAVLCLSELASNSVLHSESRRPGGTFTVRAEMRQGDYVRVEVYDGGGPWDEHPRTDGRPHGLAIVRDVAAESGTDGSALAGWIAWARLDWSVADTPLTSEENTLPRAATQA
jgi:anti-sigma regulatory factor (Ser/Thr protein kinase)